MSKLFQNTFLVIFILATSFIFISSFFLLTTKLPEQTSIQAFPLAPVAPALDSSGTQAVLAKNKVDLYTQQVAAYTQEVAAYKLYVENQKAEGPVAGRIEIYKTVIKDNLVSILTTLITATALYVFAHLGIQLFTNKKITTIE